MNVVLGEFTEVGEDGAYEMQGSAVCIDNETGYVVAIVGGREQNELGIYTLNRAYQSHRQPGSSIKPLIVYTPFFELGNNPDTIIMDEAIETESQEIEQESEAEEDTKKEEDSEVKPEKEKGFFKTT